MSTISQVKSQPVSAKNWLASTFRQVLIVGGVSALLASLEDEVNRRNPEDRERVWELLLPVARGVVWEEYVRYGETLEVYFVIDPSDADGPVPYIGAQLLSANGGWARWHVDASLNVYAGWDREVRG